MTNLTVFHGGDLSADIAERIRLEGATRKCVVDVRLLAEFEGFAGEASAAPAAAPRAAAALLVATVDAEGSPDPRAVP